MTQSSRTSSLTLVDTEMPRGRKHHPADEWKQCTSSISQVLVDTKAPFFTSRLPHHILGKFLNTLYVSRAVPLKAIRRHLRDFFEVDRVTITTFAKDQPLEEFRKDARSKSSCTDVNDVTRCLLCKITPISQYPRRRADSGSFDSRAEHDVCTCTVDGFRT